MVAADKETGKDPVVVAAENFDLELTARFTVSDVLLKLMEQTELMSWMQQSKRTETQRELPSVERVIVHMEQMSVLNPSWKQFVLQLGEQLPKQVTDLSKCIVKLCSPHLLRPGGIIHYLGDEIVSELKLVKVSVDKKPAVPQCSTKRRFDDVEPSSSDEDDD